MRPSGTSLALRMLSGNPAVAAFAALLALASGSVLVLRQELREARREAGEAISALREGGNEDFRAVELPGLNHFLQPAETGQVDEYPTIDVAYAPEALTTITSWLRGRFVEGGDG